jgi:amidase
MCPLPLIGLFRQVDLAYIADKHQPRVFRQKFQVFQFCIASASTSTRRNASHIMAASFDPLTTNAVDLQQLLRQNKISSVQIVENYLAQIERHEAKLHSFISIAPREKLLRAAASLDEERLQGKTRSPLHGIPIVLKDSFVTASDMGMGTTAGSLALVGAKASVNAAIVQRLLDAGLLILGKTNMTEFAGMKMTMIFPGWSPVGGQTVSPYTGPIAPDETLLGHSVGISKTRKTARVLIDC